MMTSSVAVGTAPVSQFAASLHKPPGGELGLAVAIQASSGLPVIVTVTSCVAVSPCESSTVTAKVSLRVSPLGTKLPSDAGRSASVHLIVPTPVPVLSVAIDAVSAFSSVCSDADGRSTPGGNSSTETVWASVRSGSSNVSVPEVGTLACKPVAPAPAVKATVGGAAVGNIGASLLPTIVMTIGWLLTWGSGVKLLLI